MHKWFNRCTAQWERIGILMREVSSPPHIILAEDNPADVELVRMALSEHDVNYEIRVISDGEQVLTFIDGLDLDSKLRCPDLLLLDLHLPKRGGTEILEHLRASKRCSQTPVVVFTSSDFMSNQEKWREKRSCPLFPKIGITQSVYGIGEDC